MALPTGTVTLLFTDIEGSTRLLDELGDTYAEVLAQHHRLMRQSFEPRGGVEVDTAGDAFFVAFERASNAVAAAAAAQEALGPTGLKVRMGIHTGQPLVAETGYVGIDVHQGARVMSAGHGGQVLVSDATRALLDSSVPLTDLGLHRLKDLTEPQRLWQLGDEEFPPLKTLYQTNLPVQPTPLIGRERELGEVIDLLRRERLVTLTGAGGSGKTRLALQAAAELTDEFKDGVWWVSLAALRDPDLVEPTIAHAVGAKEELADHLRAKRTLLLLDNFEHLLDAAALVPSILAEAPDLRVLATSRERLGLSGEHEYPVQTMATDEAIALFTARARQLRPAFEPDDAVGEICRRLDGLPLAIELAAARTKLLRPEAILERLGHSLDLLSVAARDAPARQQTLRATIDWSYELLEHEEKRLFARLAIFAGSFSLEAAEEVCGADLDVLAALLDKSLLRQTEDRRFFMLETIRGFAAEHLTEDDEADVVRRRHARLYARVARECGRDLRKGIEDGSGRFSEEIDNVRAAFEWSMSSPGSPTEAAAIVSSAWGFWVNEGYLAEGATMASRVTTDLRALPADQRAACLHGAGELLRLSGDLAVARLLKTEELDLRESMPHQDEEIATVVHDLAWIAIVSGDLIEARLLADRAVGLRRKLGDAAGTAHAENVAAAVLFFNGQFADARDTYRRLVPVFQAARNERDAAGARLMAGECSRRLGDLGSAAGDILAGFHVLARIERFSIPECLQETGALLFACGDSFRAATLLGASENLRRTYGTPLWDPDDWNEAVARTRQALGEDAFQEAWQRGAAFDEETAVELAFSALRRS